VSERFLYISVHLLSQVKNGPIAFITKHAQTLSC